MAEDSKLKALGYKIKDINGICKIYFNSKNVYLVDRNHDKHIIAVSNNINSLHNDSIIVKRTNEISSVTIIRSYDDITKYYIDSVGNIFQADWANETKYDWLSLGNMCLLHYDKKNKVRHKIKIKDRDDYYHLLSKLKSRNEFKTMIINDRYLYKYGFLIDMEKGEFGRTSSFENVYEECLCFELESTPFDLECGLFFSYDLGRMVECEKVDKDKDTGRRSYTGYYIDEMTGEKKYITIDAHYSKSGYRRWKRFIRTFDEKGDLLFHLNKSEYGWILGE